MPVRSWRQCWSAPPAHLRDDERVLTLFAPRFARQRAAFNCDPAPYAVTRAVGLYRSTEGRAFLPCLALPCLALPCLGSARLGRRLYNGAMHLTQVLSISWALPE